MSLIFNISRDDFLAGLASLQNVTGKKGNIAILSNILIESKTDSLLLTATDLEIGIRNSLPAEILSPGSITLPAKKLFEIVRESSADQIHVEIMENNWAKISADSADYKLAGMPSEEYPAFPEYDENNMTAVASEKIKEIIDKTIFSVAQEGESQFNLTGILVEKDISEGKNMLRMVSSDGHRLSLCETTVESDLSGLKMEKIILIPRKGMQEIRKFTEGSAEIKISFEEKQAVIKTDHSIVVVRLMNGDFPDYKNIISIIKKEKHIELNRVQFMNSMKKMNLFTEDRYNAVKFQVTHNKLVLSSQSMDIGSAKDEIAINYDDSPLKLGFNGKYFIETMQVMSSDTIKAYINSEESPCMIQGDDDPGFVSIIMPMKI
ncbi:MAG: DNA polymerase III subunit beta [Desulfobulbaceae bacterium]|nr:DNA polymerase III subunit beta [Desulfobulbaceae bacterium]HIJ89388.1 DNA polymerase III subunit beta [Deltaproteobacteria bacterium]